MTKYKKTLEEVEDFFAEMIDEQYVIDMFEYAGIYLNDLKDHIDDEQIVIHPQTEIDEQAIYRALNSKTMSDSVLEHYKRNKEKTKHIKIGNLHKKVDA